MRSLLLCLLLAGCATTPAKPATSAGAPKSLFERLGGMPAITAAVEDFRVRVAVDPRIARYFVKVDMMHLRDMLIQQLCADTGGPCQYTGKDMKTAHQGLAISNRDFDVLAEDMAATLDKLKVGKREKDEVLAMLSGQRGDVVGQ
jgi:hemoglobin